MTGWWAYLPWAAVAALFIWLNARHWWRRHRSGPCHWCGHPREVHTHHRRGTDCGQCGCPMYRPTWGRPERDPAPELPRRTPPDAARLPGPGHLDPVDRLLADIFRDQP
jgi:hypothetical protein